MLLVIGGASFFIIKTLLDFFGGISSTKSAIKKDIKRLTQILEGYELAPWEHDELDIISRIAEIKNDRQALADVQVGTFLSIYHEPLLAFALKEYRGSERRLVVVRYNEEIYSFIVSKNGAKIIDEGKAKGDIDLREGIKLIRGARTAFIDAYHSRELLPLEINGEPMLFIQSADHVQSDQSRVVQKLKKHDEREGEMLQLLLAYSLADRQV